MRCPLMASLGHPPGAAWRTSARRSRARSTAGSGRRGRAVSERSVVQVPFRVATPAQPAVLQRACACGQHSHGESECSEYKKKGQLQRKLAVGASNDPLEQEADRVANQVLAAPAHSVGGGAPSRIQRFAEQSAGQVDTAPASVARVLASSGRPLEPPLREDMEQRFGHDFSRVRVHSGSSAERSAQDVNANAYTLGHNIVFGAGKFSPGANEGRRLIAHELTHVIQQTGSPPLQTKKREKGLLASGLCCEQRGSRGASADGNTAAELEAKRAAAHGDDIALIRERNGLQARLIQRDSPHKAGEVTQEETEALINFKDDWRNNFSDYDQLIKITGRSYNKGQKEGIRAVKNGNSISIALGKPYFTESDEKIRWQWMKTEVIDKNVKTDKFEDIAYDPTHSKIDEIAPPYAVGQYCALNCPATAAALDIYLRTGKVSPAICNPSEEGKQGYGFDIRKNTFSTSVSWKQAETAIKNSLINMGLS